METREISKAVIKRLPRYHRYLGGLIEQGVDRISSGELSRMMNVTASQIRQDLNNFGGFGQQGYGYNVEYLYAEIGKILALDKVHPMIIVGAGHLGQAIANYAGFQRRSFCLTALFDNNPELSGKTIGVCRVHHTDELPEYLAENHTEIAILTLPAQYAQEMTDLLVENGIKAIWNFAHLDLDVPDDVIVENVHLSESLMTLSYNLSQYRENQDKH